MGNQEAKQKKAAPSSGNGSYPSLDEGWREGGGDLTKKGGKKLGKQGGKGTNSSGGGTHGTGPGKKRNKAESKSSVFSLRKRKINLKGKGDTCSIPGSNEDDLASQHDELESTKTPELSADELGHSDSEVAFPEKRKKPEHENWNKDGRGEEKSQVQLKAPTAATSPTEVGQKGGSSGSDTDIYSFHSAADHEDLLADIQLAIRLQHQQRYDGENAVSEAHTGGGGELSWRTEEACTKKSNGIEKLTPQEVLDMTPELEVGSDALSFLETETPSCSINHTDMPPLLSSRETHLSFHTDVKGQGGVQEGVGPPELNLKGERVEEAFLCIAKATKDQHADISMAARGVAVSPITMETCNNSFCNVSTDSENKCPGKFEEGDLSPPPDSNSKSIEPAEGLSSGAVFDEGDGQLGSGTSAESLEDCMLAGSKSPQYAASYNGASPSDQHCSRGSICFTTQGSPKLAKQLLKSTHSSNFYSHVVKSYPTIFPSYIKTTTRQLSTPGHSPALSPSHSPISPRRAHLHNRRYMLLLHAF